MTVSSAGRALGLVITTGVFAVPGDDRQAHPRRSLFDRLSKGSTRPPSAAVHIKRVTDDLDVNLKSRRAECERLRSQVGPIPGQFASADDRVTCGYVTLAFDVWMGHDFTERRPHREVGAWRAFVKIFSSPGPDDTPAGPDTAVFQLSDEEVEEFSGMCGNHLGEMAYTAALIAESIKRFSAWKLAFFDDHCVRVDLAAEVTAVAGRAAALRKQLRILGHAPMGHLREDPAIVDTYVQKRRNIDSQIEALLARVKALGEYRLVVAEIQRKHEKQQWFDRIAQIDDLESAIEAEVDALERNRLYAIADQSGFAAEVYIQTLTPLTASLSLVPPPQG